VRPVRRPLPPRADHRLLRMPCFSRPLIVPPREVVTSQAAETL
jgi:hypothetical protein